MRVMLNQRIWRRAAAAASARSAHVAPPLRAVAVPSLALSSATRTLHTGVRRSLLSQPAAALGSVRWSSPVHSRSVYSAADEPGDSTKEEKREAEQQAEIVADEAAHLEILERAYKGEKNWQVAQDILEEIQHSGGAGLTINVATALIEVFAARRRPDECLEALRYTREQGVRPRIHAYSSTIACCYKDLKYAHALRVFEIMRNDGYVPQHVTYSRALSAALKASQHELVLEIFDDMLRHRVEPTIVTYNSILNSCARNGDVHSALGVLRAIRQRDLEMTQSSYHSLAICGGKTGRWELARDAYEGLKEHGFVPTMTMYNSVISAYAKGKRWRDIVTLYNDMPEDMRKLLQNAYLGAVLMGFAKSADPETLRRTIEIFEEHKALGKTQELNVFSHNAVLLCYLELNELDKVHALAKEMQEQGLKWDGLTYQNVILAHIRADDIKTAQQMLAKHAKNMEFSTICYRELIQYYGEKKNDPLTACRLSMQMMQHNPRLSKQDWVTALDFAIKSGNKAVYWNFRKWMKVRAATLAHDMPPELMLTEDEPKPKRRAASKPSDNK